MAKTIGMVGLPAFGCDVPRLLPVPRITTNLRRTSSAASIGESLGFDPPSSDGLDRQFSPVDLTEFLRAHAELHRTDGRSDRLGSDC